MLIREEKARFGLMSLLNIQAALIDEENLKEYDPSEDDQEIKNKLPDQRINEIIELILHAKRPVIIAGHGVRLSGGLDVFNNVD